MASTSGSSSASTCRSTALRRIRIIAQRVQASKPCSPCRKPMNVNSFTAQISNSATTRSSGMKSGLPPKIRPSSAGTSMAPTLFSIPSWTIPISASRTSISRHRRARRKKFSPQWTLGIEEYRDYGALRSINTFHDQSHQFYFVADHSVKGIDVEAGVGVGVTASSDKLTLKLILSRDLN